MSACCECCVLLGRGPCGGLITRPEESYQLWCVVVFDLETPRMRRPWPTLGRSATGKKKNLSPICNVDLLRSLSVFFRTFTTRTTNNITTLILPSIPLQLTTSGQIELSKDSRFHFHCVSRGFIMCVLPV